MTMKKGLFKWLLPLAVILNACSKDDDVVTPVAPKATGAYILSEGNFGQNNSKLGFFTIATGTFAGDFLVQQNPGSTGLGDTGNDMVVYGSKLYVIVNNSNNVKVLNAADGKFLKDISIDQPRFAAGTNGKIYVSSYDGTVKSIDTTALSVSGSVAVGPNPEGIAVSNNNLYVAISGGFNPVFDSTVSVVSLATFTEVKKIKVGSNPYCVAADNAGNVYVGCTGNYFDINPSLVKINAGTNTVIKSADTTVGRFITYNNQLLVTGGYLGTAKVRLLNTTDFAATNFVTDGTAITNPYSVNVNEDNGDVYVTDAKNYSISGEVFRFDKTGKKISSFTTSPGVSPNKVVFVR